MAGKEGSWIAGAGKGTSRLVTRNLFPHKASVHNITQGSPRALSVYASGMKRSRASPCRRYWLGLPIFVTATGRLVICAVLSAIEDESRVWHWAGAPPLLRSTSEVDIRGLQIEVGLPQGDDN